MFDLQINRIQITIDLIKGWMIEGWMPQSAGNIAIGILEQQLSQHGG